MADFPGDGIIQEDGGGKEDQEIKGIKQHGASLPDLLSRKRGFGKNFHSGTLEPEAYSLDFMNALRMPESTKSQPRQKGQSSRSFPTTSRTFR